MNPSAIRLILASKSPRRRELLAAAGYRFDVFPPDEAAEAGICDCQRPEDLVRRLAWQKAANVARRLAAAGDCPNFRAAKMGLSPSPVPGLEGDGTGCRPPPTIVLGCDTVVECNGEILGKPTDRADARRMLQILWGQEHRVTSGLCLWPIGREEPLVEVAVTTLRTDRLSNDQLDEYLSGDDWRGKAGAFGYQDRTGWVHVVEGSESNVVGLPLELLAAMLTRLGYPVPSANA